VAMMIAFNITKQFKKWVVFSRKILRWKANKKTT